MRVKRAPNEKMQQTITIFFQAYKYLKVSILKKAGAFF
jgi:hypothetical protein